MTVNYTYVDPSEGGTLDRDTGQSLTETALDGILSDVLRLGSTDGGIARVTTQFDKTDVTLANITGLSLAVAAGQTYAFEAFLMIDITSTGGWKVAIAGTATATAIRYYIHSEVGVTSNVNSQQTALGGADGANSSGLGVGYIIIRGLITVNAAGTLTCQFAQNSAAGTSSVLVGSYFELRSA